MGKDAEETGRKVEDPDLLERIRSTIINNLLHPESSQRLVVGEAFGTQTPKRQLHKQPNQPNIRHSESGSCDWRNRPEQLPTPAEERFCQDQLNSHHGRGLFSSQHGDTVEYAECEVVEKEYSPFREAMKKGY